MKKIILLLGLLIVAMFIVGCAEKELTTEEEQALESELEQLSSEELDQVIEEGETEDTKALAGQAYQKRSFGRYSYKPSTVLKTAYKVKASKSFCGKTNALRLDQTEIFQHPNNNVYEIYLKSVSNGKAIFTINGQQTTTLSKGGSFNLADGEEFIVQEVASDGALFCVNGGAGNTITPFCGNSNAAKLGESVVYQFPNNQNYEIELKSISNKRANFEINGQQANSLEKKTTFTLADGEEFIVQEVASDGALFCINGGHGQVVS